MVWKKHRGGGGCTDRRKQIEYLTKDEMSAPTVATEALFLTCLIYAIEDCHVTAVDVPEAFIQADMEDMTVHVKMEGKMVEILTKLDPKLYQDYIQIEKGKSVLYDGF